MMTRLPRGHTAGVSLAARLRRSCLLAAAGTGVLLLLLPLLYARLLPWSLPVSLSADALAPALAEQQYGSLQPRLADWGAAAGLAWIGVLDGQGRLVAQWPAEGPTGRWLLPLPSQPIRLQGRPLGELRLLLDPCRGGRPLALAGLLLALWLGAGLLLALYLAGRLQRELGPPLQALTERLRAVREPVAPAPGVVLSPIRELRRLAEDLQRLLSELESWRHHIRHEHALLSYQAQHDPLTGCFNRGRMERDLAALIHAGRRQTQRFGVLFLDCDQFKHINDRYGHEVGDRALIHVVQLVRAHLCEGDQIGRLGGDEFMVLLPPPYVEGAAGRLAQALQRAARVPMRMPAGPPIAVGFSLGVAEYPRDGRDAASLLAKADAQMYRHKHGAGTTGR